MIEDQEPCIYTKRSTLFFNYSGPCMSAKTTLFFIKVYFIFLT